MHFQRVFISQISNFNWVHISDCVILIIAAFSESPLDKWFAQLPVTISGLRPTGDHSSIVPFDLLLSVNISPSPLRNRWCQSVLVHSCEQGLRWLSHRWLYLHFIHVLQHLTRARLIERLIQLASFDVWFLSASSWCPQRRQIRAWEHIHLLNIGPCLER